jgi:hypothetical protein
VSEPSLKDRSQSSSLAVVAPKYKNGSGSYLLPVFFGALAGADADLDDALLAPEELVGVIGPGGEAHFDAEALGEEIGVGVGLNDAEAAAGGVQGLDRGPRAGVIAAEDEGFGLGRLLEEQREGAFGDGEGRDGERRAFRRG